MTNMTTARRLLVLAGATLTLGSLGIPVPTRAALITLPVGQIARLDYTGNELFHNVNGNGAADAGDFFTGIVQFQSIRNATGTVDLSNQLADKELTAAFSFSIV